MTKSTVEVKVDGEVVGTAEVPSYDSIDEAIQDLEAAKVLKLVNRSVKADVCNKVRMAHLNDTPERKIARIAREAKKGTIDKATAAAQIQAIAAQMAG